jgi:hypothetical protein
MSLGGGPMTNTPMAPSWTTIQGRTRRDDDDGSVAGRLKSSKRTCAILSGLLSAELVRAPRWLHTYQGHEFQVLSFLSRRTTYFLCHAY